MLTIIQFNIADENSKIEYDNNDMLMIARIIKRTMILIKIIMTVAFSRSISHSDKSSKSNVNGNDGKDRNSTGGNYDSNEATKDNLMIDHLLK